MINSESHLFSGDIRTFWTVAFNNIFLYCHIAFFNIALSFVCHCIKLEKNYQNKYRDVFINILFFLRMAEK